MIQCLLALQSPETIGEHLESTFCLPFVQPEIASARRTVFRLTSSPSADACVELIADARPVVQRAGIEVRAVRPHERSDLRIQHDAIENHKVLEGTEQRAIKYRSKVDWLLGAVAEAHGELVGPNHLETDDTDDRIWHYLGGSILTGG